MEGAQRAAHPIIEIGADFRWRGAGRRPGHLQDADAFRRVDQAEPAAVAPGDNRGDGDLPADVGDQLAFVGDGAFVAPAAPIQLGEVLAGGAGDPLGLVAPRAGQPAFRDGAERVVLLKQRGDGCG